MKFVKKTKNLYFFRCDSIPELDELVSKQVIGEIKEKSHTSLLLTPRKDLDKLYEIIVYDYRNRLINCKSVCVYVTDEFLDLDDSTAYLSRHRWMNDHLFNYLNIKSKHIHYPTDYGDTEYSQYDRQIWKNGGIDLAVLVMKQDGNLVSYDFLNDRNNLTHAVKVDDYNIAELKKICHVSSDVIPHFMVSVGMRSILNAKRIIIYAKGLECANGILALSKGEINRRYPCTALVNHRDVRIYMDEAATKLLKKDNR